MVVFIHAPTCSFTRIHTRVSAFLVAPESVLAPSLASRKSRCGINTIYIAPVFILPAPKLSFRELRVLIFRLHLKSSILQPLMNPNGGSERRFLRRPFRKKRSLRFEKSEPLFQQDNLFSSLLHHHSPPTGATKKSLTRVRRAPARVSDTVTSVATTSQPQKYVARPRE